MSDREKNGFTVISGGKDGTEVPGSLTEHERYSPLRLSLLRDKALTAFNETPYGRLLNKSAEERD